MSIIDRGIDTVVAGKDLRLSAALVRKLIILFALSALTTVLFFPSLTFFGFNYGAGDVAVMDVKSPVEITEGGVRIKKGETIIRDGQIVTGGELRKFEIIEAAVKTQRSVAGAAGFFAFSLAFFLVTYLFASSNIRKFSTHPKDLLLMAAVFMGVVLMVRFSDFFAYMMKGIVPAVPVSAYKYIIPIAVGPMLVRLLLNSETALVFAGVSSVMAGYFMGGSLDMAAYSLIGGVTAAMGVRHCTQRSVVIRAGLVLGAVNGAVLISIAAIKGGSTLSEPVFILMAGLINGIVTAILAVGVAPLLESAFQYTTNIRLLELSRMDHPLLKELAVRAPGTYHHSIVIGTLVEAAAESINANPLLARVAAYYHDIGKLKMPQYFIENVSDANRHDSLAPSMSALILVSHIKDGVDMARKHRLGSEITDVISQHHGTSLITYFYEKARAQEPDSAKRADESEYRYPGPKPQTKEAGLVMLADAIEAASKTLPDPTPDRIQWLTQKIVNKIFTDGQLDECELTLKDLHAITRSFVRVFAGIYHQRIDYPGTLSILKEDAIESASGGAPLHQAGQAAKPDDKEGGRDRIKRLGLH